MRLAVKRHTETADTRRGKRKKVGKQIVGILAGIVLIIIVMSSHQSKLYASESD